MRTAAAIAIVVSLVALSVVTCGQVPRRPAGPQLDVVSPLLGQTISEDRVWYTLGNGTTWSRSVGQFRVLYDLPSTTTLFVAGTDEAGEYVLLIGGQDGLGPDCPYALRYGGREWGDAIEAHGLLWPKATDFRTPDGLGASVGEMFPGNVGFCLDDAAFVTSAYLAEPSTKEELSPSASAG